NLRASNPEPNGFTANVPPALGGPGSNPEPAPPLPKSRGQTEKNRGGAERDVVDHDPVTESSAPKPAGEKAEEVSPSPTPVDYFPIPRDPASILVGGRNPSIPLETPVLSLALVGHEDPEIKKVIKPFDFEAVPAEGKPKSLLVMDVKNHVL